VTFTSRRILTLLVFSIAVVTLFSTMAVAQDLEVLDCAAGTDLFDTPRDCANVTGGSTAYSIIAAPSVLNPVTTEDTASSSIHDHIFGSFFSGYSLLAVGAQGTTPAAASVISISEDGTTVTYTIRSGLTYSDGSAASATDVLYWYEDVVNNPNLPNSLTAVFNCPSTGAPFSVTAPDASTIEVSCPDTFRTFSGNAGALLMMSQQMALDLIEEEGIATEEGVVGPRATAEFLGLGVDLSLLRGLGPFVLDSLDSQSFASFSRNPNFYEVDSNGTRLPYLDELEIQIIPTRGQNLALQNFLSGQTDVISPRPGDIAPILGQAASGGLQVNNDIDNSTAAAGEVFVTLNFDDDNAALGTAVQSPSVRRALSLAIDRVAAVSSVLLNIGTPQYVPTTLGGAAGSTFFIGRNNTCATFADVLPNTPCGPNASGAEVLTVRGGLQVQASLIPGPVNPQMQEHLSCLADFEGCLALANSMLDAEGLTDSDGDEIRNLTDGSNWRIQVTTNAGNTIREGYTNVICDGWIKLGIECSATTTSFATLVTQLLGLGGATWTGGIVIGLTGGDPAGGVNVFKCGAALYFWHLSCDPDAKSGPTAQDPASAAVEAGFDEGFAATTVSAAQVGFDKQQEAWLAGEPFLHIAVQNALFAVRTDRLCNDGRATNGNDDIKFDITVPGNEDACSTNVGR